MATDASRQPERSTLARILDEHGHEVRRRWLARVHAVLAHYGLAEPELRDSVPDYLERLARALRREDDYVVSDRCGGEHWWQLARQQTVTRIRVGFDIDEMLREFLILRRVILEVMREHVELDAAGVEHITELMSGAMSAMVSAYVDSRDSQSRFEQAQHIGFITHELRNPLTTAMAAAGQVRKLGSSTPDLERPLELLDRGLKRLCDLIDQTLVTQRFDAHAVEFHPSELRLGDLFDEALRGAQQIATRKGIDLLVSYDPEVLLRVDPKLVMSAVQNVVDNAAKFTDEGCVEVEVEDTPNEAIIHVWDQCEGISQQELERIFEPFKRGHSGKPGTGLGLAIARRAVEAHGKTIHAESRATKGCHFWFALPKASH